MNTENILKLADFLDALPKGRFDMRSWAKDQGDEINLDDGGRDWENCGTVCCLGGWTNILFDTPHGSGPAASALGLELFPGADFMCSRDRTSRAYNLFFPLDDAIEERDPHKAARVLRHLAQTGTVDWSIP